MKTIITILLFFFISGVAMAYDVHISRGYKYSESGYKRISLDEWKKVIAQHDELQSVEYAEAKNPSTNEIIRIKTPNSAIFKKSKVEILLTWKDGVIVTTYTNDSEKIYWKEIAKWLNAQVFGEEGEGI